MTKSKSLEMEARRIIERNHVGTGAIEFMREMVSAHQGRDKRHVIIDLQDGKLHDVDDKHVKLCGWCNHYYRDKTKANMSLTCSKKCGDLRRKRKQRIEYREDNPEQPTQKEEYYYDHLEYPFWVDEQIGRNQMWAEAVPYSPDKIQEILTAREMYEYMGGRKRRVEAIDY